MPDDLRTDYRDSPFYWSAWSVALMFLFCFSGSWFVAAMFVLAYTCFWSTLSPTLAAKRSTTHS